MRSSATLSIAAIGSVFALASACSSSGDGDGTGATGSGATASGGGSSGGAASGGAASGGAATGGSATGATGGTGSGGGSTCNYTKFSATAEEAGLTVGTSVYDYKDMTTSCVTESTASAGEFCIKGEAAQVVDGMYSTIWGAGIAIDLNGGTAFDASGAAGISFTITGAPAGLRVGVTMPTSGDTDYFTTDVVEGANTLAFTDMVPGDWITDPLPLDATTLKDLKWQVPSNDKAPVPFDFCIKDLSFDGDVGMGGMGGMGGTAP